MVSLQHRSLVDQAIVFLREQITSGKWPVGSRIPNEPNLAAQLGVSRNTTREAVRALAHNGLLDIRQGAGTFVVATSELSGVMHRRFAGADCRHVVEVRNALQVAAARFAAERRTVSDVNALLDVVARQEAAWRRSDPSKFIDADRTLDAAIVAASHNDVLEAIYADLGDLLRSALGEGGGKKPGADRCAGRSRLVDAIIRRDAAGAVCEAMLRAAESDEEVLSA